MLHAIDTLLAGVCLHTVIDTVLGMFYDTIAP